MLLLRLAVGGVPWLPSAVNGRLSRYTVGYGSIALQTRIVAGCNRMTQSEKMEHHRTDTRPKSGTAIIRPDRNVICPEELK